MEWGQGASGAGGVVQLLKASLRARPVEALMQVFISWSGETSKELAGVLERWLPQTL